MRCQEVCKKALLEGGAGGRKEKGRREGRKERRKGKEDKEEQGED